jgi:hypothetical protein
MDQFWGLVLVVLGVLAWVGQGTSWLLPDVAVRLGLSEAEADVESVLWADIRGEAPWDALTLWTLPAAGLLLFLDVAAWAYLGLVGGGMYLYFGGRGLFQRLSMQRRGMRIGSPQSVRVAMAFLSVWAVIGIVTIAIAASDLPT